jgi:hypothetical protein
MNKEEYQFEADYWGNCANTMDEDIKQILYGKAMGIPRTGPYEFSIGGRRILDIGGGPSSMLLKVIDHGGSKVIDPIEWPSWTIDRYKSHNIEFDQKTGEEIKEKGWDEVWIYNCLQHVIDPQQIIKNAKKAAPVLRIFEWLDVPAHEGHPHELTQEKMDKWIGQPGNVTHVSLGPHNDYFDMPLLEHNDQGNGGKCYFGWFKHKK